MKKARETLCPQAGFPTNGQFVFDCEPEPRLQGRVFGFKLSFMKERWETTRNAEIRRSEKQTGSTRTGWLMLLFAYNLDPDLPFACANLIEIGKIDTPKLTKLHLTVHNGNGLGSSQNNGSEMCIGVQ
jgi:hypothetical protein